MDLGIEALPPARADGTKWRQVASLIAGQTYARQSMSSTQHKAQRPSAAALCVDSPHDSTKSQGQHLASPREPNRFNMNTRIVPSSLCVERKPAVKPCSYRPSPNHILSRPRAFLPSTQLCLVHALTLNSTILLRALSLHSTFLLRAPNNHFLLLGVACSHENPGRRGLRKLGTPA